MRKRECASKVGTVDKFLLSLDEGAFGALYRMLIGLVTIPAWRLLLGSEGSDWTLAPFLLLVLLLLRVALAAVRKLVPFSAEVVEAWSVRRRTAKLYDSYQWRKLIWFGAGLASYVMVSGRYYWPMEVALSMFCLFSGAGATLKWRAVVADSTFPKPT